MVFRVVDRVDAAMFSAEFTNTAAVRSNRLIARSVGGEGLIRRINDERTTPAARVALRAVWPRDTSSTATACLLLGPSLPRNHKSLTRP
jgi:hypothetical protein